jgi:hypothetical protein
LLDAAVLAFEMLPLAGELRVRVVGVTPVSIHGDMYYECLLQTAEQEASRQASKVRLASHACSMLPGGVPQVGDVLVIGFLMQQATSVKLVSRGDATA